MGLEGNKRMIPSDMVRQSKRFQNAGDATARVVATAAITLSGTQTIDGVACVAGDLVLVTKQASAPTNGLYKVASGTWTRASTRILGGMLVTITEGTTYAGSVWCLKKTGRPVVGTTSLTFVQVGKTTTTSARVVSYSTALTHSGAATIDSVVLSTGDLVLDAFNATAANRGLWTVNTSGAWSAVSSAAGALISSREGTIFGNTVWNLTDGTNSIWSFVGAINCVACGAGVTHSGLSAVDGITPTAGQLVFDSTSGIVYAADSGTWTAIGSPSFVVISGGTANGPSAYIKVSGTTYVKMGGYWA
jgi:hypothetical protein